jgi:hypothetical protein
MSPEAVTTGGSMQAGYTPELDIKEMGPPAYLQKFINAFEERGWLNQSIRIRRGNRRYWISCSETRFLAYRINDNCGISPGHPGWLVCMVKNNEVIDNSGMNAFPSAEPSAGEWLRCIALNDLEII